MSSDRGDPREPTTPRVLVVQDGTRLHYAVPVVLQRHGALARVCVDWYAKSSALVTPAAVRRKRIWTVTARASCGWSGEINCCHFTLPLTQCCQWAGYNIRMASDYKRVHRLIKILSLVQGGGDWTPARLAEEFATSERTIFRDLKILQQAGIPVRQDPDRRVYEVARDFFLPPVQLTLEEALAVIALGDGIGRGEQVPHLNQVLSAAQKLRSQLSPSIREAIASTDGRVQIRLAAINPPGGTEQIFDSAMKAVRERTVIDAAYESSSGSKSGAGGGKFKLKPYDLVFEQRAWYVVGHSSKHDDIRTYKLTRFTRFKATPEHFEIPKAWSLEKHRGNAWRMIRGGKRHFVELRFDSLFAETIADTQWHKTQATELHADETLTMTFEVDGLDEIVWWILSMGPHCTVVRPVELATRVADLAASVLAKYPATSAGTTAK
jgi:predicted DNA-binding transcriptional regulator YafY